jgi:aminoglycoside phosphotransferase (APT) family kinase protein
MSDVARILTRLEVALGPRREDPVPLEGGITNRNFRVNLGGREYVVRLPGKDTGLLGIDRASERMAAVQAGVLGIGPELAYADDDCLVTVFVGAEPLHPRGDPGPVARALRAFHDSDLQLPNQFWIPSLLTEYAELIEARSRPVPESLRRARNLVERIAEVLPLTEAVPCHDDLLPGNLLSCAGAVMLVDWEYAGMGHRLFDLGNLAVNNDFGDEAEARLLEAYFGAPALPGRRAALKLMRIVSDAREAAWGVVQGIVSELEFDFGAYARDHFERLERAAADPRMEDWLRGAAA